MKRENKKSNMKRRTVHTIVIFDHKLNIAVNPRWMPFQPSSRSFIAISLSSNQRSLPIWANSKMRAIYWSEPTECLFNPAYENLSWHLPLWRSLPIQANSKMRAIYWSEPECYTAYALRLRHLFAYNTQFHTHLQMWLLCHLISEPFYAMCYAQWACWQPCHQWGNTQGAKSPDWSPSRSSDNAHQCAWSGHDGTDSHVQEQ